MNRKHLLTLMALLTVSLILIISCTKKDEYETAEVTRDEKTGDDQFFETIKPKPINYDSMLIVMSELVQAIKNNPTDIELRRRLLATSYDTTWETILAAGFGKPFQDAETESIAMKYAEQAAAADAYRWAAYIKRWSIDPTFPDFGALNVEIKGGRVVAKQILPDNNVLVLVEIHSSNIP